MGDNTPQVGDRVRSKAVSHSDIGRITKIRSGAAQVLWPDGSRTWEQPEDLIFMGRDEPQQNYLTQGDGRLLSHFQTFNASTTGMAVEKPNWTKRPEVVIPILVVYLIGAVMSDRYIFGRKD
jgi:hypothetical protein